jgi:hypothetical protein
VPGALYTDTRTAKLYSGPPMKTRDHVSSVIEAIRAVESHAWAESGLMGEKMKMKWDSQAGAKKPSGPDLKQVNVTIGPKTFKEELKQIVIPPNSVDVAVFKLIKNGKLPPDYKKDDREASLKAIDTGVKEWYRVFFEHPIIVACLSEGIIRPWEQARTELMT